MILPLQQEVTVQQWLLLLPHRWLLVQNPWEGYHYRLEKHFVDPQTLARGPPGVPGTQFGNYWSAEQREQRISRILFDLLL